MKKQLLFLAFAGLFCLLSQAQTPLCFTSEYYHEALLNDPQFARNQIMLENFTQQFSKEQSKYRQSNTLPYIIPVVFHILHNYGPENVSDNIIIEAVRLLNLDFRKLNSDTSNIVPSFKQIASDCEIEFRLATIDPSGNCTNGIEHIVTQKTYSANEESKLNPWPNNKYLNIWVAQSLAQAGAAAYAYYPGTTNPSRDGIMCWYPYVNNTQRTLTHEVGHCLNLKHPWGDNNNVEVACGDDNCFDTPETKGWSPGHCNLSGSVCNPPIIENVQNYMDYSYCDNMFTHDQKTRMHASLNSSVGGRNNLWKDANLIATGTNGPPSLCAPIVDFIIDHTFACKGDLVHFTDKSWNGTATNWNWFFPGGSPSTSTLKNPTISYSATGIYNATLVASNSYGSDSITKNSLIHVTADPLNAIPFIENFEDSTSFPGNDGWIDNPSGGVTWTRVTNAGSSGFASIKMNNYINAAGDVDSWVTPSFDFSNVNSPISISFKIAYTQRNSTSNDELQLFYSLDCSQSWISTSYQKSGASLSTVGVFSFNYTPHNSSDWRQEIVNVDIVKLKPNVRFKFQNTCDHGNNIYIDDININGTIVGVNDLDELQSEFLIYPNPTSGITTVNFLMSKTNNAKLEVKDIFGRTVAIIFDEIIEFGLHKRNLPVLTSGIYLIDLTINNKHYIRKLVVS